MDPIFFGPFCLDLDQRGVFRNGTDLTGVLSHWGHGERILILRHLAPQGKQQ